VHGGGENALSGFKRTTGEVLENLLIRELRPARPNVFWSTL